MVNRRQGDVPCVSGDELAACLMYFFEYTLLKAIAYAFLGSVALAVVLMVVIFIIWVASELIK